MRHVVGSALVLLAVAFLGGCAGGKATAKAPASPHMSVAMDDATSRALLGEDDGPVGTTTLTSATYLPQPATVLGSLPGMTPRPEEVIGDEETPMQTWGASAAAPADVDGIPTARE